MAMTDIAGFLPLFRQTNIGSVSPTARTLDTTDDWTAWVFSWPGGDLTKIAFYVTAAAGSPVVTVQLFNVDSSDGTATPVDTASPIGSAVDSATLVANTPETVTGIGQTSLPYGTYAIRIIFKSGTSCAIKTTQAGVDGVATRQLPTGVNVTNGGAQTMTSINAPAISLGGSQFVPLIGFGTVAQFVAATFNSGSNPDEYGIWFANHLPVDVRLCGAWHANFTSSTRPDLRLSYYTGTLGSPTQVFSDVFDRDVALQASAGANFMPFSAKQTLAAGSTAGIGIRAATAENITIPYADFLTGNESQMDGWWGQNAIMFTRVGDAGALTQIAFQTPVIIPLFDGIDPGTSSIVSGATLRPAQVT